MALQRKITVPVVVSGIWQRAEEHHTHNMTFDLYHDGNEQVDNPQLFLRDASAQSGVTSFRISIGDLEEVLHELGYTEVDLSARS